MIHRVLITAVLFALSLPIFAKDIYNFKLESAEASKSLDFSSFKKRPLLIVNIATRCGYTSQLDDLEKLYKKYKDKGLQVVGVPSNDFGGQTPEGNTEVAKFCRLKYGVSFPISQKIKVKGSDKHPLYKTLTSLDQNGEVSWNFVKFLIDKNGKLVKRFSSGVDPLESEITKEIEKLL